MFAFVVRRIVQALFVMLIISLVGFSIKNEIGDPSSGHGRRTGHAGRTGGAAGQAGTQRSVCHPIPPIRKAMPFKGIWGYPSFTKSRPWRSSRAKAPATLELVFGAALIVILISLPIGVFSAIYPRSAFSRFTMAFSTLGVSVPVFLTAIVLIFIFSVELNWLPSYGRGETISLGGWDSGLLTVDGIKHLILPSFSLASIMLPLFIRLIRSEMMEVLETEYIKFAWAKGLQPSNASGLLHAFKNTLLPVDYRVRRPDRHHVRVYHPHRNGLSMAGHGLHVSLEAVERSDISLLVAYLWWWGPFSSSSTPWWISFTAGESHHPDCGKIMNRTWQRFKSYLLFSFKRDKTAIFSLAVLLALLVTGLLAPVISPYDPYDPGNIDIMNSELPPSWTEDG
jgi:peptide/nickel transport system permease protein